MLRTKPIETKPFSMSSCHVVSRDIYSPSPPKALPLVPTPASTHITIREGNAYHVTTYYYYSLCQLLENFILAGQIGGDLVMQQNAVSQLITH